MMIEPRTNENARPGVPAPERTMRRKQDLLARVAWFSSLAMYFTTSDGHEQPLILEFIPIGAENAVEVCELAAALGLDMPEMAVILQMGINEGWPMCFTPAGTIYRPRNNAELAAYVGWLMKHGKKVRFPLHPSRTPYMTPRDAVIREIRERAASIPLPAGIRERATWAVDRTGSGGR